MKNGVNSFKFRISSMNSINSNNEYKLFLEYEYFQQISTNLIPIINDTYATYEVETSKALNIIPSSFNVLSSLLESNFTYNLQHLVHKKTNNNQ